MWANTKVCVQISTEDDISESCQRIQQRKAPGTQGTDVNDLLPLALNNFIRRKVKIFCSRKACPISDVIPTMELLSIFNLIYLALFVPTGTPEHCDGWIPSKTHAGPYRLQTQKEKVDELSYVQPADPETTVTPPTQPADPERIVTPPSQPAYHETTIAPASQTVDSETTVTPPKQPTDPETTATPPTQPTHPKTTVV